MEFRQVEYALAVAEVGSFTRAAESLHVTQPSLSAGIAGLERELGIRLFDRIGRRVALSSAGEAFLEPARQLIRDARNVRASVASVRGLQSGHLDVVALPTLAVDPLVQLIGAFRRLYPGVVVRVFEPESADEVLRLVRSGPAEIGFAELPVPEAGLVVTPLFVQEIVAVWPPGTTLPSGAKRYALRRLAGVPIVTTPAGTSTRRLIDEAFSAIGVEPTLAVETGQREAILPLVAAGAGTTFLPEAVVRRAEGPFVTRRLDPPITRKIGIAVRTGPMSPGAARFVEIARARYTNDRRRES
jgi:LysR family carnitine catabolism transcriptional activator